MIVFKHIYYYENVVLKRAKNDRRFTESEIIDIIGWAIALDNLWHNEAIGWKIKGLNHYSECNVQSLCQLSPSKQLVHHLLNNIRLSVPCLEKFLRISAEHIPALNLSEDEINSCINEREELKTLLKDCLLNIRASETDGCKDIASDKLQCLLNTIRQDNSLLVVLQREKKRFGIDSHQKELLCLAILSDTSTRNNKELIQDEEPWPITKHITSQMLTSPSMSHQQQVDLLLWMDEIMFGSMNSPPLSYFHTYYVNLESPVTKEQRFDENTRMKNRKDFILSLKLI